MTLDPNAPILVNPQETSLFEVYDEKKLKRITFGALADATNNYVSGLSSGYFNVKYYGAIGNGLVNDTNAIKNAISAAGANGTVFFPDGNYIINDTLVFSCNVFSTPNARILVGDIEIGIEIENTSVLISHKIVLPSIINNTSPFWSNGNIGTKTGVLVKGLYASELHIPFVYEFDVGVKLTGSSNNGCAYNRFYFGTLADNAINLLISPVQDGWVNENYFYGGRCQHYSGKGENVIGTRQIEITHGFGTSAPNGNQWFGFSLEGNVAEYAILCGGRYNQWFGCRFESANRVHFSNNGSTPARWNAIFGGYEINLINVTQDNLCHSNNIYGNRQIKYSSDQPEGIQVLQNNFSSNNPSLLIMPSTADILEDDLTNWSASLSANNLSGKLSVDTQANIILDFANGRLGLGVGGSTAISSYIDYGATRDTFTFNKEIEFTDNGDGLIMRSPNGTLYRLTVNNSGQLSIVGI